MCIYVASRFNDDKLGILTSIRGEDKRLIGPTNPAVLRSIISVIMNSAHI